MAIGLKTKYPATEGWLHMDLYLSNAKAIGEAEIKKLVLPKGEDPTLTEWGLIEQHGKRLEVVLRSPRK